MKSKKWWIINSILVFLILAFILFFCYAILNKKKQQLILQHSTHKNIYKLSDVIVNTNLYVIKTDGLDKPTEQQIKDKLKELNPNLDIDKIKVENITDIKTIISSNDTNVYTGIVTIKYSVNKNSKLSVVITNNIDLNKTYIPNNILFQHRGYKGTWIYNKNGKYYKYDKNNYYGNYNDLTTKEQKIINAFLSTAENKNLSFYEKEIFNSSEKLLNYLHTGVRNLWKELINNICQKYQEKLKQLMLLFYNYVANVLDKRSANNILHGIIVNKFLLSFGTTTAKNRIIQISPIILECNYKDIINNEWKNGGKSSNNFFHTLIHELGHIVHYYYDFNNIDIVFHLKNFLKSKINNFNYSHIDIESIFKNFSTSSYGLISNYEFIAEGFAYWFLTPNELKTKAWEFWHEYFTNYLVDIKNKHLKTTKIKYTILDKI